MQRNKAKVGDTIIVISLKLKNKYNSEYIVTDCLLDEPGDIRVDVGNNNGLWLHLDMYEVVDKIGSVSNTELPSAEEKLDMIMDKLDDWLLAEEFAACDNFLLGVHTDRYSNSQLLTMLTATVAAKDKLPFRKNFYNRVQTRLRLRGKDEQELLRGLE